MASPIVITVPAADLGTARPLGHGLFLEVAPDGEFSICWDEYHGRVYYHCTALWPRPHPPIRFPVTPIRYHPEYPETTTYVVCLAGADEEAVARAAPAAVKDTMVYWG